MTILTVLLLLAASLALLYLDQQRLAVGILFANLTTVVVIGTGILPALVADRTRPTDLSWSGHDTIVLLGAGTAVSPTDASPVLPLFGFSRPAVAARIYFNCRRYQPDCKVVVSGGDPQHHGISEAEVNAELLRGLRVPPADIVLEISSINTWQNAQNSMVKIGPLRPITLVTSGLHLQRAILCFRHFTSHIRGIPSDTAAVDLSAIPRAYNFFVMDSLIHEKLGIAQLYIYDALGFRP